MNKTLSQYKPHERDSVLEMGEVERDRFIATLNDDPCAALTAQTKIIELRQDHRNELEQLEQQRQYLETEALAETCDLAYKKAVLDLDAEEENLKNQQEERLNQVLEIEEIEVERLEQKLNAQHPKKVENKEYLELMREYNKLMKLHAFEQAHSVKILAEKLEYTHFTKLVDDFDSRNEMLLNELLSRHDKELFILHQQFEQERQNMGKRRNQRLFEIVQGCKNDKTDMDNAFRNEFIGSKQRCMDEDIVVHRRSQNACGSTFKGSLKKAQLVEALRIE